MSNTPPRASIDSVRLDDTSAAEKGTAELTVVVDELLNQLTTKFASISEEMLTKMDEMAIRLDNLEAQIQAGGANSSRSSETGK